MLMKIEAMVVSFLICFAFLDIVASHSWIDCVDYEVATQTCKGRPRNWYKRPATPFGQDVGRDIRPGKDVPQGLFCDTQKESINSPVSAGYNANAPMARLARGREWTMTWPAKNHADVGKQRGVQIFISKTPGGGDDFSHITSKAAWVQKYPELQKTFSNCNPPGPNNDRAFCMGTFTLPGDLAPGVYTLMWWWEFNAGEFYNSCADIEVLAPNSGPNTPATSPPTMAPPSPATPSPPAGGPGTCDPGCQDLPLDCGTCEEEQKLWNMCNYASNIPYFNTRCLATCGICKKCPGQCDPNCKDLPLESGTCEENEQLWNMCSYATDIPYFKKRCAATCSICQPCAALPTVLLTDVAAQPDLGRRVYDKKSKTMMEVQGDGSLQAGTKNMLRSED